MAKNCTAQSELYLRVAKQIGHSETNDQLTFQAILWVHQPLLMADFYLAEKTLESSDN